MFLILVVKSFRAVAIRPAVAKQYDPLYLDHKEDDTDSFLCLRAVIRAKQPHIYIPDSLTS